MDFGDIERACADTQRELDHRLLNDIAGLENPTSEILARWIWNRLATRLPGVAAVAVRETARSTCVYRGPSEPERSA
jgi:6-pyruvoyltetrahydropterin/6-carboxytetrahydropterin synthase